jgi:23S rRNA G2069 N7-methylase RlmK/C1962 C5-methylase RlmI
LDGNLCCKIFEWIGNSEHRAGATEVCAVDVAAKAHARARRNFAASSFDPEQPEHLVGDAFKVLARFVERHRTFDMVIIDPPAFASAAARGGKPWSAVRDYAELIAASLEVLVPGGLLAAASSTHKMSAAEFELYTPSPCRHRCRARAWRAARASSFPDRRPTAR